MGWIDKTNSQLQWGYNWCFQKMEGWVTSSGRDQKSLAGAVSGSRNCSFEGFEIFEVEPIAGCVEFNTDYEGNDLPFQLNNANEACWSDNGGKCGTNQGRCNWCGDGGLCCRKTDDDWPASWQ